MIKHILIIFFILLLGSGSVLSNDWEVFDIRDKGWHEELDHQQYRSLAVATCNKKNKFTFQFKGSNRTKDKLSNGKHVVRYFCSTSKLTVDPINGDTFPIKSLVFGKPGSMPNPLYWTNYNDDQKLRNKNSNNVSNGKTMDLRTIKEICLSFGYTEGTEKFADCSMDLYLKNN